MSTDSSEFEGKVTYEPNSSTFQMGKKPNYRHKAVCSSSHCWPLNLLYCTILSFNNINHLRFYVFVPAVVRFPWAVSSVHYGRWLMKCNPTRNGHWNNFLMNVQQLWDVSSPATPEATMIEHVGATFGIRDGESLRLWLEIDSAYEREDGRWQLSAAGFDELRIDQLVFSQISDARSGRLSDGLDEQIVQFSIIATRALLLDLMMLEALLVVDEQPTNSIHHIDTAMTQPLRLPHIIADGRQGPLVSMMLLGSVCKPYCIQSVLPSRCDCELDLLDLQVDYSTNSMQMTHHRSVHFVPQVASSRTQVSLLLLRSSSDLLSSSTMKTEDEKPRNWLKHTLLFRQFGHHSSEVAFFALWKCLLLPRH